MERSRSWHMAVIAFYMACTALGASSLEGCGVYSGPLCLAGSLFMASAAFAAPLALSCASGCGSQARFAGAAVAMLALASALCAWSALALAGGVSGACAVAAAKLLSLWPGYAAVAVAAVRGARCSRVAGSAP